MHFFESLPLLTILVIEHAKCSTHGQEKVISAHMAELSKTESGLVTYFLDQLYVVKSKIQQLEKGGKEMKLALSSWERRIKVVENRKETRCESGTVRDYGFKPTAKWPHSRRIDFRSPFSGTPTLTYGLYALDVSNGANTRVDTVVTNLSRTGFQLTLRTWADTELFAAFASWMACGK
ncbi:uncharacterized protein LOC128191957 [Crassostrea angulata]|uniref:uncharacterized protein LOC128191957 n=1 Tax=Magallana angulata TaxID=2784310 RepID=UPI0022B0ADB1|nr:uncharacterized protein LOC128191957 [Crassostrea angulata]